MTARTRIKAWLTQFQQSQWAKLRARELHLQETRRAEAIRRQWRAGNLEQKLTLLPLHLLLRAQLNTLEEKKEPTGFALALRKLWQRIARRTPSGSATSGPLSVWPIRRLYPPLVQWRRRCLVWLLCLGLKAVRRSLGIRKPCNP